MAMVLRFSNLVGPFSYPLHLTTTVINIYCITVISLYYHYTYGLVSILFTVFFFLLKTFNYKHK